MADDARVKTQAKGGLKKPVTGAPAPVQKQTPPPPPSVSPPRRPAGAPLVRIRVADARYRPSRLGDLLYQAKRIADREIAATPTDETAFWRAYFPPPRLSAAFEAFMDVLWQYVAAHERVITGTQAAERLAASDTTDDATYDAQLAALEADTVSFERLSAELLTARASLTTEDSTYHNEAMDEELRALAETFRA